MSGKRILIIEKYGKILHAIQKNSEHPLAEPVVRYLENAGIKSDSVPVRIESITGMGVKAVVGGETFYAGNRKMMDDNNIVN